MASLPKLESRMTVASGATIDITEDGGAAFTVTITAGSYFPNELATQLATDITDHGSSIGTYSCTLDDDSDADPSGLTVLQELGSLTTEFTITWNNAASQAVRDWLGYTIDLSGALAYSSDYQCNGLWLPPVGRTNSRAPEPTMLPYTYLVMGVPSAHYVFTRAPTGASRRFTIGTVYEDRLEFFSVTGRKTHQKFEAYYRESFEAFYTNLVTSGTGRRVRYFPDREDDTLYADLIVENAQMMMVEPLVPGWTNNASTLWRIGPYRVLRHIG